MCRPTSRGLRSIQTNSCRTRRPTDVQYATLSGAESESATGRPYIALKGVSQTFRRDGTTTHALDRIDLKVAQGEFVAIVGQSACGNSTLLLLIAGLLLDNGGSLHVDGKEAN